MSITINIDVDDLLDELSDEELLEEIRVRNINAPARNLDDLDRMLQEIHSLRERGEDYQALLSEYIWERVGYISTC